MNNISIYQIILTLISLFFIMSQSVRFLKRESGQSFFKFIVLELIWISILLLTLFPDISRTISYTLGFGDNLNTLIFIGFVVVFIIIFKLLNIVEKLERNLSEIVRKEALKNVKDETIH
jgi:hypothetical protein